MEESNQMKRMNRRGFAGLLAAGTAAAQQAGGQEPPQTAALLEAPRVGTEVEILPFQMPLKFSRKPATPKVQPFPLSAVRLLDGAFRQAQEWNRGYLNRLPVDRLVHNFRLNAGLGSTAQPLGGWEEPKGELRGHFTGHFLSACALMYGSTGDAAIKAKGDEIVAELAKCQAKLAGGYLSAFPTEFFDRVRARRRVWAPFYTVHKIMAGMLDMYVHAGNRQALEVLKGMSAWADNWSAALAEPHMQAVLTTEYGGMNDILYKLAAVTGEDRWAAAGDRFTKKAFFNPLGLRRDELRGLHVNTHIPQVLGAAVRYELSSDSRFRDVAEYFYQIVTGGHAYVTGGSSNGEGWLTGYGRLAEELKRSTDTAECCCAYNMLKLARQLYGWTGDARYFDYYERTLLNHRLGTIYPESGATMYYLSHTPGAFKTFGAEDQSFWCCTGSGVEEFSKLADSIYFHDAAGVYVNLYMASELNWQERGLKLKQETRFPAEGSTTLTIAAAPGAALALRLRMPEWLNGRARVKLNGQTLETTAEPGGYLSLERVWKAGDKLELELPMGLRTLAMPDEPALQAALYGPLVLAGELGSEGVSKATTIGKGGPEMGQGPFPAPVLRTAAGRVENALQAAGPLQFETRGQAKNYTLRPLNALFDRRYTIYWQVE